MHIDEVRNNLFYQFPQWLLKEPYNNLSHRAMLMYMLLWDRRGLSEKNNWYDKDGKVYAYFTNEQFMEVLFQSTHPCGVRRLVHCFPLRMQNFNPRTHVGCDAGNKRKQRSK